MSEMTETTEQDFDMFSGMSGWPDLNAYMDEGTWDYGLTYAGGEESGVEEDKPGEGEQLELDKDAQMDMDADSFADPDSDNNGFHLTFVDRPHASHVKIALSQEMIASVRYVRLEDDIDTKMIAALQNPLCYTPKINGKT
jgi:hypothetical protein